MTDDSKHAKIISDAIEMIHERHKYALQTEDQRVHQSHYYARDFGEDIFTPLEGKTKGSVPKWLNGTLVRNGPGTSQVGDSKYNHLFDCLGMLRKFKIKSGFVTFECKLLRSDTYKKNMEAQRVVVDEYGTRRSRDPCQTLFQRFCSSFQIDEPSDNCPISYYPLNDEFYAFGEFPFIHRIDPDTLDSLGRVSIADKTKLNIVHHTSHPHIMPDGTVCNVGLAVGAGRPKYTVVEFPKTKRGTESDGDIFSEARIIAQVPARWSFSPSYMHSFGITPNYAVILEQPLAISITQIIKSKFTGEPFNNAMVWNEGYSTLINVVSKFSNEAFMFEAEPFAYFHTINQYEEEGHIVLDVCVYRDSQFLNKVSLDSLEKNSRDPNFAKLFRSRPVRFVLPLHPPADCPPDVNLVSLSNTYAKAFRSKDTGNVVVLPEILADVGCEMPRIHYPELCGQKYRYFYSVTTDTDITTGLIAKVDTETKTFKSWHENNAYASEPIFVAAPDQKDEDDGVLLTSVIGTGPLENQIALVVLDAKDLTELGRAEFALPRPISLDFHGWFKES